MVRGGSLLALLLFALVAVMLDVTAGASDNAARTDVSRHSASGVAAGECTIEMGIECSSIIVQCFLVCKEYKSDPQGCFSCLGSQRATCCPCLQKSFGSHFPCS